MGRSIEFSGKLLGLCLYAVQVALVLAALLYVAPRLDSPADVLIGGLFALLVAVGAVGLWRMKNDKTEPEYLGTAEDITYDPFAYPGQAAKHRWEKAVRRLPGWDDEED